MHNLPNGFYERSDKTESRLVRRRFSQKTKEQICFVCFFAFHGKQNKLICSFFGRIYGEPKLLLVFSNLQVNDKTISKILQIFVAFLEKLNLNEVNRETFSFLL